MKSRFVNLVVKHMNGRRIPYSLHRIDPAKLFYPAGSPAPNSEAIAEAAKMEDDPLPPPFISFDWPCPTGENCSMDFLAFGRNRDRIIAIDNIGRTYLYNPLLRSIHTNLPIMRQHILMKPVAVSVGDNSIFLMSRGKNPRFVALMHDPSANNSRDLSRLSWYWQCLQPPPFPSRSCNENKDDDNQRRFDIRAYTMVGHSQILVSTAGGGTFSFDTESYAWNKAGGWPLPFRGRAEFVPEHNLWFGFSDKDELLCATDLSVVSTERPPVPQHLSKDLVWPKHWTLRSTDLVLLASGKICIARFFQSSGCSDITNNFVVLVGVEVVSHQGRLRMIQHKSVRYSFGLDLADPL